MAAAGCRAAMTLRSAALALVLLVAAAAAPGVRDEAAAGASLQRLRPCAGESPASWAASAEEAATAVCVEVEIDPVQGGGSGDASNASSAAGLVACIALDGNVTAPPRFPDGFVDSVLRRCPAPRCRIRIEGLRPATEYRAFCAFLARSGDAAAASRERVLPDCAEASDACGLPVSTGSATVGDEEHSKFGVGSLCSAGLVIVYMVWSFRFEHVHGVHETTVAVLAGLLFGGVVYKFFGSTPTFNFDMFSFVVLPMVIFDAGFNLEKKRFFWYSTAIIGLGIIGTVTVFVLIFFGSSLDNYYPDLFVAVSGDDVVLSTHHRLILASVLSSTDTVAPMAFLPSDVYPRLFAIIFGEGVMNDVVAIILSKSISASSSLPTAPELFGQILYFLTTSTLFGLAFGFAVSYIFKHSTWLHEEVTHPCALMLLLNYSCYVLAEMADISSIFALFVCALLCGHYAESSLSKEAARFADSISEFFAYCAEAFVFGYFGFTAVQYLVSPRHFSISLVLFYVACIIVARFLAVALLDISMRLLRLNHSSLGLKELVVIALAGCMRGTIAYALIIRAMPSAEEQTDMEVVMVSTVLGIVLVNCLVFGGIFPVVMRVLDVKPPTQALLNRGVATFSENSESRYRVRVWMHERLTKLDREIVQPFLRRARSSPSSPGTS